MALYEICPNCGATLDIGEMCECDHDMFNMKKVMEDVGEIIDKTEDEIRKGLNLDDDFGIVLDKGEIFLKATKEVSECLETLPLTKEQNNNLVALMVENVGQARQDAFMQGFQMGQDFQEYCNLFHGGNENEHTKH